MKQLFLEREELTTSAGFLIEYRDTPSPAVQFSSNLTFFRKLRKACLNALHRPALLTLH